MANAQSEIKLHIATTGQEAAVSNVAKVAAAVQQVDVASQTLSAGAVRATGTTQTFGQSMLTAAYFADDLQYGIKGVLNNIPMMTMALGMGAGAAGVVSILAVGFSVLSSQMGWFDEKAQETTGNLKELAKESRNAATTARAEAEATDAAEEALRAHNERLEDAEEAYNKQTEAIKKGAQARQEMARAAKEESDAQASLEMARIEETLALQQGSPGAAQEAERAKLELQKKQAQEDFNAEQEELRKKQEDAEKTAKAEESKALAAAAEAARLRAAGGKKMDTENRAAAERELAEAINARKAAQRNLEDTPESLITYQRGPGGDRAVGVKNPAFEAAQKKVEEAAAAQLAASRVLQEDDNLYKRLGFKDGDALRQKLDELAKTEENGLKNAADSREEIPKLTGKRERGVGIFAVQQEERETRARTRIAEFDQRDERERQQEAERAARKREQGINREGRDVMRGMRGGIDENSMALLEEVVSEAAGGGAKEAGKLTELLKILVAQLRRNNADSATLQKDIRELESQLAEQRNGR